MGMLLTMGDYSKPLPPKEEVVVPQNSPVEETAEKPKKKVAKKSK